jgi:hypothetical protein
MSNIVVLRRLFPSIVLLLIIGGIYSLWAVQPPPSDDWPYQPLSISIPESGQYLRYEIGHKLFYVNPFSLFKPASLLIAILAGSLMWLAFRYEPVAIRSVLTLAMILGFPYLGMVGSWNLGSSTYTLPALWVLAWFLTFKAAESDPKNGIKLCLFFVVTFFATLWHEVWIAMFCCIVGFLFLKAIMVRKSNHWVLFLVTLAGYLFALMYFAHGGPEQFVERRLNKPGSMATVLTWAHFGKTLLGGTKETLVLIKDCLPVFFVLGYAKLSPGFQNRLKPVRVRMRMRMRMQSQSRNWSLIRQ